MGCKEAETWSAFQNKVADRFEDDAYSTGSETAIGMYLYLLNAPERTGCEGELLEYWEKNPDVTLDELYKKYSDMEDELYPNGYNCDEDE